MKYMFYFQLVFHFSQKKLSSSVTFFVAAFLVAAPLMAALAAFFGACTISDIPISNIFIISKITLAG